MTFGLLSKIVAYLVAALGFAALALGTELGLAAELVIAAAYVASWFAEGPRIRSVAWARGWTVALFALLAVQIVRGALGASVLSLGLEFTAALQISRLFNRKSAAEHQQIAGLAVLHLVAATVLSSELGYALIFLGFVIVMPWAFALSHLRAEIEAPRADGDEDTAKGVERALASRGLVGPSFLLGTAGLSIPLFVGTGMLFLLFPRVGMGFLSLDRGNGQRVTGFGSNVELGDFGVIRSDPTVVLRVTPPDLGDRPPPVRSIRMRGTSFDHYDGHRWTRSRELGARSVARYDDFYAVPHRLAHLEYDQPWGVVLDQLDEPVVFFPPGAVSLQITPRVESGIDVGRDIFAAPGMDIRYGDADGLGLRYTAWTSERPPRPEPLDPALARRYLQVPEGHDRVAALARAWTAGATTDAERIERLTARLRDSGEYTYSLEMPALDGRLPLDVFLFEAKRGHCEYYATALAVMLRTLGVPTRNVTGFLGGRFNEFGRYYALAQGDAHSWVEAHVEGRGWVTVDPTPPARSAIAPDPGWAATLTELFDALETRWAEDIVAYDLRDQVDGLRRAWRMYRRAREAISSAEEGREPGAAAARASGGGGRRLLIGLAVALALGGLAFVLWRRRRRGADDPIDPAMRGIVAVYRELERALARAGHPRPPSRTPAEHVEALEAAGFEGVATAREVTERYLAARYGGAAPDEAELARLRAAIRAL